MADDWKPGDLALCVRGNPFGHDATRAGRIYTVLSAHLWDGLVGLQLLEAPHERVGSAASRFRRIPPHTPDAEDLRTIALLNGKPVKEPVNG